MVPLESPSALPISSLLSSDTYLQRCGCYWHVKVIIQPHKRGLRVAPLESPSMVSHSQYLSPLSPNVNITAIISGVASYLRAPLQKLD